VLIYVLLTSSSKSIFFMLPAVAKETSTSIIVVPFVALIDDILDRARDDFGINYLK
jgi:superfamily II DNA helicase RecQ